MDEMNPTRARLLQAGLDLAMERGLRGIAVREVAKRAEANLGSFVYHFGTRDQFLAELVERWYAPMYESLKLTREAAPSGRAHEALRTLLHQVLGLMSVHARFITHLVADALAGEAAVQAFLLRMPDRHPRLILELATQAQREGRLLADQPPLHLMAYLMAASAVPLLVAAGPLSRTTWLPAQAAPILEALKDPARARQRLDWAFQGISIPCSPTPDEARSL